MSLLRRYLRGDAITAAEGGSVLRLAFAAMFSAQAAVALLVALVLTLATATPSGSSGVLGVVLIVLSLLQAPLGVAAALAPLPEPERARTAALQRTLLGAVLLSTPAWYLAFLLVTGGGGWAALIVAALLALYWLLGVLLATRLGQRAAAG